MTMHDTTIDRTPAPPQEGGCHGGRETMLQAARAAGKSETIAQLTADYPRGPHDQPQSMCPAFGALRVGLRMRRVATILSGSACCVYGLTFTSHFYGARRSVGYVPFNSEIAGDRPALRGHPQRRVPDVAKPDQLRRCGNHQSLRADRLGRAARPAAETDRRRAHHRHRRARLRRADACRGQGRAVRRHAPLCAAGSRGRARWRARAAWCSASPW